MGMKCNEYWLNCVRNDDTQYLVLFCERKGATLYFKIKEFYQYIYCRFFIIYIPVSKSK